MTGHYVANDKTEEMYQRIYGFIDGSCRSAKTKQDFSGICATEKAKFSNFLNEKVFNKKVDRGIKTTDFAPHVDDIGMAVTLMADKSKISTTITRTVPAFLCVPGYEIGTHRD